MDSTDSSSPTTLQYAPTSQTIHPWGKGFLAVCATFAVPGLGHMLAGRIRRGGLWLATALACELMGLWFIMPDLILPAMVALPIILLLILCMYVDAFICGRRSSKPMLGRAPARYATGTAIIVGTIFFHPWGAFSSFLVNHILSGRVKTFSISSGSMTPTLSPGDRIFAHKKDSLERWNLVVYYSPLDSTSSYVARVVGLPGEFVEIKKNAIFVDGRSMTAPTGAGPYVSYPYAGNHNGDLQGMPGAGCEGNPIRLGKGEYYLLCDNSTRALDARLWEKPFPGHPLGATPTEQIHYRVSAIYWPLKRWHVFAK